MQYNISRLIVAAIVWAIVQDMIKLSRPTIEENRMTIVKEVAILTAIVIGLVAYNR